MHSFTDIRPAPADPVFSVSTAYQNDPSDVKVNLTVGAYRDNEGKPVVFDAVHTAGSRIYAPGSGAIKEYLPMGGSDKFCQLARDLIFGPDATAVKEKRIATVQTLSGTGALTLLGQFLRKTVPRETRVYVSNPTWPNHTFIYSELCGFEVLTYRYWDPKLVGGNITAMIDDIKAAPKGSVFILHACAHNPTGEDPTTAEWDSILEAIKDREHFTILDSAYQGFATRDFDRDAYAIRLFEKSGLRFGVCQSFAKNMGLYGERVGAAHLVCPSSEEAALVHGRFKRICRLLWSNPPRHGAEIATMIMAEPDLRANWLKQLEGVSQRITDMRVALRDHLEKLQTPGTWTHITKQIGMFSYTGLTPPQVKVLTDKYHIYLMASGRISMAGLNESNVEYVAKAIDDAVRNA